MTEESPKSFGSLGDDVTRFAAAKSEELKLKAAKCVSDVLSRFLTYFLLLVILGIALGLLAYALLQWLNGLFGAPWGTLSVLGVFLVALVVLWINKDRLFKHLFTGILTDKNSEELDTAIGYAESEAVLAKSAIDADYRSIKRKFTPAKMVMNFFSRKSGYIEIASALLSIIGLTRKKRKKHV